MDAAAYAVDAVRLANAALPDLSALREHLAGRPDAASRVTDRDLRTLRALRSRIREVFAAAGGGDPDGAVELLNAVLARSPVVPVVRRHDGRPWHLHVTALDSAPAHDLAAEALVGLAMLVAEHGADRLGVCAGAVCGDVFVDTSPGRTRRYCSQRCASRTNVAALRARRAGRSMAGNAAVPPPVHA